MSVMCLMFATIATGVWAREIKPLLIVKPFTTAPEVTLPYDMKLLQTQLVAELKYLVGKDFEVVAERPEADTRAAYTLEAQIVDWRPGNAAKRVIVGFGSGREASDLAYKIIGADDKPVVEFTDTIRTNFYSQAAGSTGTLAHPIAQKIASRIKAAKLLDRHP
jgi:hypothetical protein